MKALVKSHSKKLELKEIHKPFINGDNQVLIKVKKAGICRTDIYVSNGWITNVRDNLTVGHEFCGVVEESTSNKFKKGDFVACNPIFDDLTMLGLEHHGCFAEYIKLPSEKLYHADGINPDLAAYAEPIAASLAPLKSKNINKEQVGGIYGINRISELTLNIMKDAGYNVQLIDENDKNIKEEYYDFIIETYSQTEAFNNITKMLKRNGTFILKSRNPEHIPVNFYEVVKKEITMEALYYNDFQLAVDYARDKSYLFEHLLGNSYYLEEWEEAYKENEKGLKKIFFKIDD